MPRKTTDERNALYVIYLPDGEKIRAIDINTINLMIGGIEVDARVRLDALDQPSQQKKLEHSTTYRHAYRNAVIDIINKICRTAEEIQNMVDPSTKTE